MDLDLLNHTLVINLGEREDRKLTVMVQLRNIGVNQPERVAAVKTKDGAIGCSMSHIKCLEIARKGEWEYVCIVEDDFKCVDPEKFKTSLSNFQQKSVKDNIDWDVLLLGGNNCPPYNKLPNVDYCVQISNCQSAIGYVVKRRFYDTMIQNYREGVAQLMRDPKNKRLFAVDMYWKRLQGSGKWFILTPLTITQETSYSDIEEKMVNYDHLMLDIDKPWFFSNQVHMQNMMKNMICIKGT
jgi:GR25 family glycosyltransferase involved in LPS biosynthesis